MGLFSPLRKLLINRRTTNLVRIFMDNWIPPAIRDSRWFMKPFFRFAYKGNPRLEMYMEFKSRLYSLTPGILEELYQDYDTIGTERLTDLNEKSIRYILQNIQNGSRNLLDVGCGKGYFLSRVAEKGYEVHGCDVVRNREFSFASYTSGNVESLPFPDNSFDVVTCNHTLEHVLDLRKAVSELKRVARTQLIITVPCQRSFYYTVDLHLHFFPVREMLTELIQMEDYSIKKIQGDWVFIGTKKNHP